MKCIIAGSRSQVLREHVYKAVELSGWAAHISEVVSGHCPGDTSADMHGEQWSLEKLGREATLFPYIRALGPAGGPARNKQMAQYADYCIAVPYELSTSRGTASMIGFARQMGLRLFVYEVRSGKYWFEYAGRAYGAGCVTPHTHVAPQASGPEFIDISPFIHTEGR